MTNDQKAAYIAGFFDGEGCIGRWRMKDSYWTRSITACNTEMVLFDRVCGLLVDLGFKISIYSDASKMKKWAPRKVVSIRGGREAFAQFGALIPLQSEAKRSDLAELLASYVEDRGLRRRKRTTMSCAICKSEFEATPSIVARGVQFCSRKCRGQSSQKRQVKICETCGIEFSVILARVKSARFCSASCFGISQADRVRLMASVAAKARWKCA